MNKLRKNTVGLWGFWGLCSMVGVAACGTTFDSEDCKTNRTCPPAAGTGNVSAGEAGTAPSKGGSGGYGAGGADSGAPAGAGGEGEELPLEGGAGAGGQGEVAAVNPPPTVLKVSPTDGERDVETTAVVSVMFSEPLTAETVNATSVKLTRAGREVSGTVTYADSVVTFKPARPLALLGNYELTLTTDVTDVEGAALQAPLQSKFVVRDGQFSVVTAVEEDAQYAASNIPVEPDGSVLMVWTDHNYGDDCPVLYQRFLRGLALGSAQSLSAEGATSCSQPTAASSASGVSAIAWGEYSGTRPVNVVQFRDGMRSPRATVSGQNATGGYISLGIAETGVVSVFDSDGQDVWGYHTDSTGKWAAKADKVATIAAVDNSGRVAFDAEGNGLAVKAVQQGTLYQIITSRFTPAADEWSTATLLPGSKATKAGETFRPRAPALAVAPTGDAAAMWVVGDSTQWKLMASRFEPSTGWSTAAPIGTEWSGGLVAYQPPALVFDGETFVAAFTANQGSKLQTWVTRLDTASGAWSTPEKRQAAQDQVSDETMPRLATDGHGNLILVWFGGLSPSFKPYYQRYAARAWSSTRAVSSVPTSRTYYATLSSNADGLAAFTWTDADGADASKIYLASFY